MRFIFSLIIKLLDVSFDEHWDIWRSSFSFQALGRRMKVKFEDFAVKTTLQNCVD
jgi:hypothetical protein